MAAALFRSVEFIRSVSNVSNSFVSFLRSSFYLTRAVPRRRRNTLLLSRCLSTKFVQSVDFSQSRARRDVDTRGSPVQKLDRALYRLDVEVRKTGRISLRDVQEIFAEIKTAGVASATQSLLAIRCCGSLLPEELPAKRIELVTDVWNTLRSLDVPLDVSHYNALLKVYLENEHEFTPTDFLAEMEAKAVEPNRVTYQRLIGRYCQRGDIAGASKILDFMKEKDLPINENVFNSLIQGHFRAGDVESAKSVLGVMRNAKLDPSADTYTCLMRGYAEKGDMDGIRQAINEAEGGEVFLLDRDYMEVLVALAPHVQSEFIDEILSKMRKQVGYNQDVINTIFQLVNNGQDDVAYKLLLTMSRLMPVDGVSFGTGQFFIRQMVKVGRPVEKIIEIINDLKRRSLNSVGLLRATESSLLFERTDYAEIFLKTLHEEGSDIRPHYFWPILVSHRKSSNEEGIYKTLKLMISLNSMATFDTLLEYVFPAIRLQDPESVIQILKDLGHTVNSVVGPLVTQLVIDRELQAAVSLMRKHPVNFVPTSLVRPLVAACSSSTDDLDSVLELLVKMNESREPNQRTDWTGQFLLSYVRANNGQVGNLELILHGLKSNNLNISHASAELLRNRIDAQSFAQFVPLLEELTSSTLEVQGEEGESGGAMQHPRDMSLQELEAHYIELKAKNMNTRGILRRLLFQYCRFKNLERAMEIKKELDESNFVYTPAMYAQLMDLCVSHDQLDNALLYRTKMLEQDPEFPVDDHKVLNLAALLVKSEKSDEAIKVISEHHSKHDIRENSESLNANVWRLLSAASTKGDVDTVQRLFDLVVNCGYALPTNTVLGPTVKVHLIKNDLEGALKQFEHCCKVHRCTPLKNELFVKLIHLEDAENLQKVVDLSTEVHGEMNTMYDLAFAFIDCNQVRQARKILETPGIRARHQRLDSICEKYVAENKVASIEIIVSITRDLFDIDRDRMYFHLLRAYAKTDDVDKALGVWTALQEENVQPSDKTLVFLGNFLKRHNKPVPFVIPEKSSTDWPTSVVNQERHSNLKGMQNFLEALRNEDITVAMELKRELEQKGHTISISSLSNLIEVLMKNSRTDEAFCIVKEMFKKNLYPARRTLKQLLHSVSYTGDVASVELIGNHLSDALKMDCRFNNHLAVALIASGRHMELLESMEKKFPNKENIPGGVGILRLLEEHPELSDRVERLASSYAQHGITNPLNMVWMHHFVNADYEKADEIFKSTPVFQERLMYLHILQKAVLNSDESMIRRLVDVVKGTRLTTRSKGVVYGNLVDLHNKNGELEKALNVFKEAVALNLTPVDFNRPTLNRLKQSLEQSGQPVPFTVPSKQDIEAAAQSSSSSSSDSDGSDDERK